MNTSSPRRRSHELVLEGLHVYKVLPVIELPDIEIVLPLYDALAHGGLPLMELTLRTPYALPAIQRLVADRTDAVVGAGTVRTAAQASQAIAAGAKFVVSPIVDEAIMATCRAAGVLAIPGIATPTELQVALGAGAHVVKFFPAGPFGGVAAVRAFGPVFPEARFIPTGGVSPDNLLSYLRVPQVLACGGSWLTPSQLLRENALTAITELAGQAAQLVLESRRTS